MQNAMPAIGSVRSTQPTRSNRVLPFQSPYVSYLHRVSSSHDWAVCFTFTHLISRNIRDKTCQAPKQRKSAPVLHIRVAYQLPSNRYTVSRPRKKAPTDWGFFYCEL